MTFLPEVVAVLGLLVLRLGVPIAIMAVIGYFLMRLDARWEAEARQEAETRAEERLWDSVAPGEPMPLPLLTAQDIFGMPCWDLKDCDESKRTSCPAFKNSGIPCWLARRKVEGAIPAECPHCELFAEAHLPSAAQSSGPQVYH